MFQLFRKSCGMAVDSENVYLMRSKLSIPATQKRSFTPENPTARSPVLEKLVGAAQVKDQFPIDWLSI
jgi:hypothetical protein